MSLWVFPSSPFQLNIFIRLANCLALRGLTVCTEKWPTCEEGREVWKELGVLGHKSNS